MKKKRLTKKEKLRISMIIIAVMMLPALLVATVYNDWKQILANRKQEIELTQEYEDLLAEEEKLTSEITKLGDDEYLARYAKEKYMLSSEDDTIIIIDKTDDTTE